SDSDTTQRTAFQMEDSGADRTDNLSSRARVARDDNTWFWDLFFQESGVAECYLCAEYSVSLLREGDGALRGKSVGENLAPP
ncbi:hypothetical protein OSA54_02240, partial [Treponema pallidum]